MKADVATNALDLCRGLASLDESARLERIQAIVAVLAMRFEPGVCSNLAELLEGVANCRRSDVLKGLPNTPNAAWLRAQLASDSAAAVVAWRQFFLFQVPRDPFDLLSYARTLASAGRSEEAAQQLRSALSQYPAHVFFARAEKLVSELSASVHTNIRRCKIAVLGSSTTAFLVPIMRALCLRDRIEASFYEAPYGSIEQEIWNETSGLAKFRPTIVMLAMNWRDLALDAVTQDEGIWVERFIEQRKLQWSRLSERFACHILQPAFDYPARESYGVLAGSLAGGRTRLIDTLNLRLREQAPPNVAILDLPSVQRCVGNKKWQDDLGWIRYRQHPSIEALPDLAEAYMAVIRAALGTTRKVLVTDLDNTLWHGIIGEDGIDGIKIGPDSHEGEAHLALQQYMLELRRRGILLAVCSKNNPDDARLPFLQHTQMALKLDDFAAFRANWEDKVTNLRAIAQELSLGLDSFVFLDDNPIECEWVRSQLPEIAVIEVGRPPLNALHQLDHGRYFESLSVSSEDLARADQYRVEAQRKSLLSTSASLEEFLQSLKMEGASEEVTDKNLARVTQLINKTNQFNLTTRRYTEAQVREIACDPECWIRAFRLSDRMGSYGLIAVLICRAAAAHDTWQIDSWLMSCRVLGRDMEKFMLDRLLEAAAARGIKHIEATYLPTPKNALVKDLCPRLGFWCVAESAAETRYMFDVPSMFAATADHIRNVNTSSPSTVPDGAYVTSIAP